MDLGYANVDKKVALSRLHPGRGWPIFVELEELDTIGNEAEYEGCGATTLFIPPDAVDLNTSGSEPWFRTIGGKVLAAGLHV